MNAKQIAIEALEQAIEFAKQQLDNLEQKLENLKGVQTLDEGDPVPPDPTHPKPPKHS